MRNTHSAQVEGLREFFEHNSDVPSGRDHRCYFGDISGFFDLYVLYCHEENRRAFDFTTFEQYVLANRIGFVHAAGFEASLVKEYNTLKKMRITLKFSA